MGKAVGKKLTIALDAMGGDEAPASVVEGALMALARQPDLYFHLYGDGTKIAAALERFPALKSSCEIIHTDSAIAAHDKPSVALRQGRKSSMRLAIDAVRAGAADAAVSAGNTGALMAMGKVVLRMLEGIYRPAIITVMPTMRGQTAMLDLGANVECDAEDLFQFAIMGDAFARVVLDLKNPRVGLLNVGSEEMKGHEEVKAAHQLLKNSEFKLNYHGFVEGNDIPAGTVDVVVTDGFSGNIALKTAEGVAHMLSTLFAQLFRHSIWTKIGYLFARPGIKKLKKTIDHRRYNGAMLIGLNGILVKSHGSADAFAFSHAVEVAAILARNKINTRIIEEIRKSGVMRPRNEESEPVHA